jgi:hypothetical protein
MKLSSTRFTVRWLMVAVAAVAGILAFLASMKDAYWVGFANVPLRFTILDDASGRPISRASVRLPGSTVYEAPPTGDDGKTTVVIRVMCSGQVGILRRTRHANFLSWNIRVVAPGYRTFTGSLENRTQDPRFHEENPDPPPIVIRMEREPERPASEGHG